MAKAAALVARATTNSILLLSEYQKRCTPRFQMTADAMLAVAGLGQRLRAAILAFRHVGAIWREGAAGPSYIGKRIKDARL